MHLSLLRILSVPYLTAALALTGCSTMTPLVNEWSNPGYASPAFKKIMVGGSGEAASIRRNLEDEFVTQLRAAGVEALPSYRYLSDDRNIGEAALRQAAQKVGADAAILVRGVNVEQKTEYEPGFYPFGGVFGVFGRNFGASWGVPYGWPTARRSNEYTSETTLYDVTKNQVVWTGTLKSSEPDNVNAAIRSYVAAVVKALDEKNLIESKKRH